MEANEGLLEEVLGVVGCNPKRPYGGEDQALIAVHQLAPRRLIPGSRAGEHLLNIMHRSMLQEVGWWVHAGGARDGASRYETPSGDGVLRRAPGTGWALLPGEDLQP